MASVSISRVIPASPERVWQLIGGFTSVPGWLPLPEPISLEGGRVRQFLLPKASPPPKAATARWSAGIQRSRNALHLRHLPGSFSLHQPRGGAAGVPDRGRPGLSRGAVDEPLHPPGGSEEEGRAVFTAMYPVGLESIAKALA